MKKMHLRSLFDIHKSMKSISEYKNIRKEYSNILLFVLFISLILFVFLVALNEEFGCDEFEAVHTAWKVLNGKTLYIDFFQNHNPLFYYILSPILLIFGPHIKTLYILRFLEFLFFTGTSALIYTIGKLEFDREIGHLAVILSIPAMLIFKGIEIRPDVPMLFFELLGFYLLILFIEKKKKSYLFLSAVALALSFLILQKAVIFILLICAFYATKHYLKKLG